LKENMYKNNPQTSEKLKQNNDLWISHLTAETLHRVASNMRKTANACITECSGHFQHFIQHSVLSSDFSVIYFLTNRTCVRNWLPDFSITL
jgi:hypothetical protein